MPLRDQNGLTEQEFLSAYQPGDYPRPSVASDIVIFTVADLPQNNYRKLPQKALSVLLIKRGGHPYLGSWALPGGFVRPTESVGEAARRELLEETGVEHAYLEQLYTFSDPGRDPRTWVMSCTHMALLESSTLRLEAGDDASDAAWFRIGYHLLPGDCSTPAAGIQRYRLELQNGQDCLSAVVEQHIGRHCTRYRLAENNGLAFDHAKIIAYALGRLRGKVEYTGLAFNLMPQTFTLTELQQVYEVILGKPLLKAAFRRKIAPLVQQTNCYRESAGHRPSLLYRRNWEGDAQ